MGTLYLYIATFIAGFGFIAYSFSNGSIDFFDFTYHSFLFFILISAMYRLEKCVGWVEGKMDQEKG